jgi:fused signal recognition particle receptor
MVLERLKEGLSRTHQGFVNRLERLLTGRNVITPDLLDDLLEILIPSDIGVDTAAHIIKSVEEGIEEGRLKTPEQLLQSIREEILEILRQAEGKLEPKKVSTWVIMFVGVNGSGKTTTIAKLGHRWIREGRKVSFAAADTFRAGAVEQLQIWSERVGAGFYHGRYGADPSSVVFDAVNGARARGDDILLIDTAGRLHTSSNLMEELKKIQRTCRKALPESPQEVLLILDATTGQNALRQARVFHDALELSGIVLTKLDGTAKGGIIVAIARELSIPVKLVGVGEAPEDLQEFRAGEFVEALFSD